MQVDIISKLNNLFYERTASEITEAETLYVLAQIRKLSERLTDEECAKYSTLLFYCNWALHTRMDRRPVKGVLDDLGNNWVVGAGANGKEDFFGFVTFRDELESFLNYFGIFPYIASDQDSWFDFRNHLIQILIDCPLERTDTKIVKFSLLKQPQGLGIPTDDYMYWFEVVLDTGETEEWNIMLADLGPKRRAQVQKENTQFMQRFVDKVKYRRETARRLSKADPDASGSPTETH